jgi:hypothetical protein
MSPFLLPEKGQITWQKAMDSDGEQHFRLTFKAMKL